ncbi:MAG: hypothetical protein JWM16_5333 [Verrucomicrobiales bacterium]|nr:hypothetical protein [Verrucomicrobiales bacterium]
MATAVQGLATGRAQAEDQVGYRYEYYGEEHGRIQVDTHSVHFEKKVSDAIAAKGDLIYDGISGATPNGLPPSPGSTQVALTRLHDIRRAGDLGIDGRWGRQLLSPLVAYSRESDYESIGLSLNDAIDFNNKNTTLRLGVAHNFDRVLDFPEGAQPRRWQNKEATEGLIGISQLLGPKTVFTADFTYGAESGFLSDPYRNVLFRGWLVFGPNFYIPHREVRPHDRTKEVFQTSLTHFFDRLDGSVEVTYRLHHDSYDVFSHTAAVAWHQKVGTHLILEPMFRFYEQSAAYFYFPEGVPGFSPADGDLTRPAVYSADYRLSHMFTLTYGMQATIILKDWLHLDMGYHRYEMHGLDHITAASAYPVANIVTAGLRLWF